MKRFDILPSQPIGFTRDETISYRDRVLEDASRSNGEWVWLSGASPPPIGNGSDPSIGLSHARIMLYAYAWTGSPAYGGGNGSVTACRNGTAAFLRLVFFRMI